MQSTKAHQEKLNQFSNILAEQISKNLINKTFD